MADIEERAVGDLVVRIDRSICVGFGHCIDEAAEAFRLVDDNLVTFHEPEQVDRERLVAACDACPVGALSAETVSSRQLA